MGDQPPPAAAAWEDTASFDDLKKAIVQETGPNTRALNDLANNLDAYGKSIADAHNQLGDQLRTYVPRWDADFAQVFGAKFNEQLTQVDPMLGMLGNAARELRTLTETMRTLPEAMDKIESDRQSKTTTVSNPYTTSYSVTPGINPEEARQRALAALGPMRQQYAKAYNSLVDVFNQGPWKGAQAAPPAPPANQPGGPGHPGGPGTPGAPKAKTPGGPKSPGSPGAQTPGGPGTGSPGAATPGDDPAAGGGNPAAGGGDPTTSGGNPGSADGTSPDGGATDPSAQLPSDQGTQTPTGPSDSKFDPTSYQPMTPPSEDQTQDLTRPDVPQLAQSNPPTFTPTPVTPIHNTPLTTPVSHHQTTPNLPPFDPSDYTPTPLKDPAINRSLTNPSGPLNNVTSSTGPLNNLRNQGRGLNPSTLDEPVNPNRSIATNRPTGLNEPTAGFSPGSGTATPPTAAAGGGPAAAAAAAQNANRGGMPYLPPPMMGGAGAGKQGGGVKPGVAENPAVPDLDGRNRRDKPRNVGVPEQLRGRVDDPRGERGPAPRPRRGRKKTVARSAEILDEHLWQVGDGNR